MTAVTTTTRKYSAEEYFEREIASAVRSEFRDGKIVEITGGTPAHNEITRMFVFLLTAALRKQAYSIFVTDQCL